MVKPTYKREYNHSEEESPSTKKGWRNPYTGIESRPSSTSEDQRSYVRVTIYVDERGKRFSSTKKTDVGVF